MTADERTEAEVRGDRALRRGELSSALSLYQAIAEAFPSDEVIALKLKRIRETLQPMELQHAKTRPPADPGPTPSGSVQEAEALAAKGDYPAAISIYRRALAQRPDSPLIKERLDELVTLAQSMAPRQTTARAERDDAPVSSPRMLSDLLDQISRRRRGGPPKG
jgi:tetratricopeptide (TPR) repeat protein